MYRAVGNRCAVDIGGLSLPLEEREALNILTRLGFRIVEFDLVKAARGLVGQAKYRRGARLSEAPEVFDCSGLAKWLYAQKGVWLPRRSIQQREFGHKTELQNIKAGDLVFTSGRINYYETNRGDGVGHVGIFSGEDSVVHAANSKIGITESPLESFISNNTFRGVRRYAKKPDTLTLETPSTREVETSDDIKWIILQTL